MRNNFVIYCEDYNGDFTPKHAKNIQKAMNGFVKSDIRLAVELIFTDEEEIRRLNRELRDTDRVTDVLSFPTLDNIKGKDISKKDFADCVDENKNLVIGSIAICEKRAMEQAEEYNHSYNRELHYLLIHGIMHCLGYDHIEEEDKKEMREKEECILNKLKITRED